MYGGAISEGTYLRLRAAVSGMGPCVQVTSLVVVCVVSSPDPQVLLRKVQVGTCGWVETSCCNNVYVYSVC